MRGKQGNYRLLCDPQFHWLLGAALASGLQPGSTLVKGISEKLCSSCDPKDGEGMTGMEHPGVFMDTLQMSDTPCTVKTLHQSLQVWRHEEPGEDMLMLVGFWLLMSSELNNNYARNSVFHQHLRGAVAKKTGTVSELESSSTFCSQALSFEFRGKQSSKDWNL